MANLLCNYRKRLTYKEAYSGLLRWWEKLFLFIGGRHG